MENLQSDGGGGGGGVDTLSVDDACHVTMAGIWRTDGVVSKIHADGYDVYLQDEKITLTNKPSVEVKKANFAKGDHRALALEAARQKVLAPQYAAARRVRFGQQYACAAVLLLLSVLLAYAAAMCFVTGFSLKPSSPESSPDMCELCSYRYGCHMWPSDNPRCHEHFMPWIYAGSAALTLAVFPALFFSMLCHDFRGGGTLAEEGRYTLYEHLNPLCDDVCLWRRTGWCCGDEGDYMDAFDSAAERIPRARYAILNQRMESWDSPLRRPAAMV